MFHVRHYNGTCGIELVSRIGNHASLTLLFSALTAGSLEAHPLLWLFRRSYRHRFLAGVLALAALLSHTIALSHHAVRSANAALAIAGPAATDEIGAALATDLQIICHAAAKSSPSPSSKGKTSSCPLCQHACSSVSLLPTLASKVPSLTLEGPRILVGARELGGLNAGYRMRPFGQGPPVIS